MENSTQNNKNKKLTLFDILLMIILLPFYLLFSKKTRKVTWILIVIVLLIISFINIKNPKKQEQKALEQQQTMVQQGIAAEQNQDYEKALEYYGKGGEEGNLKKKELLIAMAMNKNRDYESYDKVLKYLLEEHPGVFTEEEAHAAVLENMQQAFQEIQPDSEGNIDDAFLRKIIESCESIVKNDTPGKTELLSEAYNLKAEYTLKYEAESMEYGGINWSEIKESWSKCTSGAGFELNQAMEKIKTGEYAAAIELIGKQMDNKQIINDLWMDSAEDIDFISLDHILQYYAEYHMRYPESTPKERIDWKEWLKCGIHQMHDSIPLTDAMVTDLKENSGTEPKDGVIILHRIPKEETLYYATEFMNVMPVQNFPYNVKNIRYVILLDAHEVLTGAVYSQGTKQIREDVTLTLYDVTTGEEVLVLEKEGPVNYVISYTGTPPSHYSAGSANIKSLIQEALDMVNAAKTASTSSQ